MPYSVNSALVLPAADFRIVDVFGQVGPKVSKTSVPAGLIFPTLFPIGTSHYQISYLCWPGGKFTPVMLDIDLSGQPFMDLGTSPGDTQAFIVAGTFREWGVIVGNSPTFDIEWTQLDNPSVNLVAAYNPFDFNAATELPTFGTALNTSGDECPNFRIKITPTSIPGNNGIIFVGLVFVTWS